jgi:CHAT domain-containing protein/Tfp pilus assembly protein PilF
MFRVISTNHQPQAKPQTPASRNPQSAIELVPGAPIERELKGGEVHFYRITLASGQFLHVVVDQRGIEVVVRLLRLDGQPLAQVYSMTGTQGPVPIYLVAEASGDYRLEVRPHDKESASGRYEARIEELRNATPQDQSRLAAQSALAEGTQLDKQGIAESRRRGIEKYEEALTLWRTVEDHLAEAYTLTGIANIYHSLGEGQKELDYLLQALPLWRALGDRRIEAITLNNIGLDYVWLGETRRGLDHFGQALLLYRAVRDREGEATALNNIGWAYELLDETQKALQYYGQALPLLRTLGHRQGEAFLLNNIGTVYRDLGEKQKALDYYNQALPLFRTLGNQRMEAVLLSNIGTVYNDLGEHQKALDYFNQALPLRQAVGDRRGEASTLNNIGRVYDRLGEQQKALGYYDQALQLRRAVGDRRGEASTLNNIGYVYASLDEKQKALDYFGQALRLARAVGDRTGEMNTLSGLARVERDRGNLSEAHAEMEAALRIIESLRTKVPGQELRASYLASKRDYYEFYVDLLMRLHQRQPSDGHDAAALQASERARARSLLETLTEARADIRQGVDPEWLERERTLQQQLNAKERYRMQLLSGKHTEEQATAAEKELRELLTQYQEVQAQIRARSPRYAALTQPQPLSLKEIQQQVLDEDTILLEYALGDERSFLWAVTTTSITSFELPKRDEIETAARHVVELLVAKADAQYPEALAALSQMLLGPVAGQLGKKRLLIVSDGALQYVPFGALPKPVASGQWSVVSKKKAASKSRNCPPSTVHCPLILDHEIVTLPSASVLAVLRRELAGRKPAAKIAAVLADPVFDKDDERVKVRLATRKSESTSTEKKPDESSTRAGEGPLLESDLTRSARQSGLLSFDRLPFSRQEARQIAALASADQRLTALDFAANRATATSADLSQYRIIHFATHGLLNSQHPELSGIVLSLVDEYGQPQDGFLRLHEIYNLNLPAELVVLSGCRTGLGKEIKGEGLVGLTRGFMYAGAARVLVSLWDVSDAGTAELMKRFYRAMLKQGLRPAAALRAAQISMWQEKQWNAPYYWAGFVLQGEWR